MQERQTAYKTDICSLQSGKYIVKEGWEPNYVRSSGRNISRANIIASVVDKTNDSIILDDGSGKISARVFDENPFLSEVNIGEIVMFIGRPREFNGEIFLVPEIIKKINDTKWVVVRKRELEKIPKVVDKVSGEIQEEEKLEVSEEKVEVNDVSPSIIEIIKKLDQGDGAAIEDIISETKDENTENIINNLLMNGDVFEVKPGRIKVLE